MNARRHDALAARPASSEGMSQASHDTDEALLAAFRRGDRTAADRLFERHFDVLFDFFSSKLRGDVKDLVQRTFLACLEARGHWPEDASFRAYLFGIAKHELYRHFRMEAAGRRLDFSVSSLADLAPGPSSVVTRNRAREDLLESLRALPLESQCLLELRYFQALSGPELAGLFEVPEGTLRTRLRRALELLAAQMKRRGGDRRLVPEALVTDEDFDAWAASLRDVHAE